VQELQDVPLAPLTTIRLGGPARRLVTATTDAEIIATVRAADASGEPLLILGGGSNVIIADKGFQGTVLLIATTGYTLDGTALDAAAGHAWSDLVDDTVLRHGLAGIEFLAAIPGTVGATPIQNVNAYGEEVANAITEVVAYDRVTRETVTLDNAACGFSYRHSTFKAQPDRYVVLRVRFTLEDAAGLSAPVRYAEVAQSLGVRQNHRVPLGAAWNQVRALRAGKGMALDPADHDTWSAGSFFTNPVLDPVQYPQFLTRVRDRLGPEVTPPAFAAAEGSTKVPAAWLIEKAGFAKGHGSGPARLSTKHTLALTNRGQATTEDLLALAREVRTGVHSAFGVHLVNEPALVGVEL